MWPDSNSDLMSFMLYNKNIFPPVYHTTIIIPTINDVCYASGLKIYGFWAAKSLIYYLIDYIYNIYWMLEGSEKFVNDESTLMWNSKSKQIKTPLQSK